MYKRLYDIISNMSGFVLAIGLDDKLAEKIESNELITKCDILNYIPKKNSDSRKKEKLKTINIKKIRKIYKKKNVDYIICNYDHVSKFLKTFIKDSVYINKSKLYFYGNVDKDIIKKYERYDTTIVVKDYKETCIVEIDNTKAKNNVFKEFKYKIIDGFNSFIEFVGDVLMG